MVTGAGKAPARADAVERQDGYARRRPEETALYELVPAGGDVPAPATEETSGHESPLSIAALIAGSWIARREMSQSARPASAEATPPSTPSAPRCASGRRRPS